MHPSVALESFKPLLALLGKPCEALKNFISVPELPVPLMALAVSELSSPRAGAGTDTTSVLC